MRRRAVVSWSSGKDGAFALHETLRAGELEVVGLLTTVTEDFGRVSMHGVREEVLDLQSRALGRPCFRVRIPHPCPNEIYEVRMGSMLGHFRALGIDTVVFGDVSLEDVRAYRESRMASVRMQCSFPLWGRDTAVLARDMMSWGLHATITCVDPKRLDRSFAGSAWDGPLLEALPPSVDPCGENGEFHTLVTDAPLFSSPIAVQAGEVVERDGFVFADFLPDGR
jgi:uncharacterized protein (TIGR00290 family)